jgi:hypothetical protein
VVPLQEFEPQEFEGTRNLRWCWCWPTSFRSVPMRDNTARWIFSTLRIVRGTPPEFRGMILQMAATVYFEPPPAGAEASGRIRQVLG